jgi:conjugative transfer signal peptidase TraF
MTGQSPDRTVALVGVVLFVVCLLAAIFQFFGGAGLRINTSPSLPMGLYVVSRNLNANLVEFCPAEPFGSLAIVRGWRAAGSCPDGAAPLLKPIVARAGDVVEMSAIGLTVNGRLLSNTAPLARDSKGRPLRPWAFGRYAVGPQTVWVASSYNAQSFDSRYFGPVPVTVIRDHLRPLLTAH